MVFVRDEGSVYDAPVDQVWRFFRSGSEHSKVHRHREVRPQDLSEHSGRYSWVQDFRGRAERFTMEWTAFAPVGLGYEVTEGVFAGSRFFLYYVPQDGRTEVNVVGEFASPTIPADHLEAAVTEFFSTEFDQDRQAIRKRAMRP